MPDLLTELRRLGEVARVGTLRGRGISAATLAAALEACTVTRPRRGWIASPNADVDQIRAIAVGARIGCISALRRFGVWAGTDRALHLHAPPTARRLDVDLTRDRARWATIRGMSQGAWHPSVSRVRPPGEGVRVSDVDAAPRLHWRPDPARNEALDWLVSPRTALATAIRCLDDEHARAAIDSILHEGVLTRRAVEATIDMLPGTAAGLVDEFTGVPESGVESLFVRRLRNAGFTVVPQFDLAPHGRYDGVIDGCVLFEIDGRGSHSSSDSFFKDRDQTLVAQSFGVPVLRPSALHVLEHWPATFAAVSRVVEDARIVRRARGLPPIR